MSKYSKNKKLDFSKIEKFESVTAKKKEIVKSLLPIFRFKLEFRKIGSLENRKCRK